MKTHWFIWKGRNSYSEFGLWVRKLPKRVKPKERGEEIIIPGRAGCLMMTEGEDVYSAYSGEMTVSCKNTVNPDRLTEWLRGSGDLILSTDTGKAYTARIVNEVSFDRDEKEKLLIGTIPFLFQPFRKSVRPEADAFDVPAAAQGAATMRNRGDAACRPTVRIVGSGSNEITIGDSAMTFESLNGTASKPVIVDCEAEMITRNGALWTGTAGGEFWRIPKGSFTISQTGSMDITVEPNWRWM